MSVDGFRLLVQTDPLQGDGLGLEGGGVDDLRAGLSVAALEGNQGIGVGKDPFFRAAAPWHTGFHQIGGGGPVQNVQSACDLCVKFFFGEHKNLDE